MLHFYLLYFMYDFIINIYCYATEWSRVQNAVDEVAFGGAGDACEVSS